MFKFAENFSIRIFSVSRDVLLFFSQTMSPGPSPLKVKLFQILSNILWIVSIRYSKSTPMVYWSAGCLDTRRVVTPIICINREYRDSPAYSSLGSIVTNTPGILLNLGIKTPTRNVSIHQGDEQSNKAMKQCDGALNASPLQFLCQHSTLHCFNFLP